jgi:hypothetical protein
MCDVYEEKIEDIKEIIRGRKLNKDVCFVFL